MKPDESGTAAAERRLDDAFQAPEFDDSRAERVLTAARTLERAGRVRGRGRGVGFAVALATCAAVAVAVVVWSSVWSGNRPAGSTSAPRTRRSATSWSVAEGSAGSLSAQRQLTPGIASETASALGRSRAADFSVGQGLWFSTELVSEPAVASDPLVVRLTLTNFWGPTAQWNDFSFGLSVTTIYQPDPSAPDGIQIGGIEAKRAVPGSRRPLVLRSGESTTVVLSTGVPAGTWQVAGSYVGDQGDPYARTPPITIVVSPRPPAARKGP